MSDRQSASKDAGGRLRRLLALLAHVAQVKEVAIAELATRFSMEPSEVVAELELAACCGLPPYTPDQLLELVVDDDTVYAFGLESLRRPPRLTPDEGFAVAAAARTILAVGGAEPGGPLERALHKLEQSLGQDRLDVELSAPELLGELRRAASTGEVVEIDYLGAQRGAETTRQVEPYAVVMREGRLYLDGYCRSAKDWRRFQLSRIAAVRPTGEHANPGRPPSELESPRAFVGAGREVTIALPLDRQLLVEHLVTGELERSNDQRLRLRLRVGDEAFLGRLVLRLGEGAEVIEPSDFVGAPAKVARRALERYASR